MCVTALPLRCCSSLKPSFITIKMTPAACWICLGEEVDDEGGALVRDCSWRGDSAGFAHASCIAEYAKSKSKQAKDPVAFSLVWASCPNCNQNYQHQLMLDLSSSFVEFAETTYGPGKKENGA